MDLEVEGRHALLFDDDAAAAFVNSPEALVQWNSLFIDRYDVRHLLSPPPPPRKFARRDSAEQSSGALESEIERERFLDLPPPPSCEDEDSEVGGKADVKSFHSVAFSYGNGDENDEHKVSDIDTGFRPSFPVPESLLQNLMLWSKDGVRASQGCHSRAPCFVLMSRAVGFAGGLRMPKTDKVHQIIARTALFVREHGGQSEIVLRVKQGDNPTFGFLMPGHQLHPYFRLLIDHPEVMTSDSNGKSSEVVNVPESEPASAGGALSLLGSTYGSGEDEDIQDGTKLDSDENKSNVTVDDYVSGGLGYGKPLEVATLNAKQILVSRSSSSKDKAAVIKKNRSSALHKVEKSKLTRRKLGSGKDDLMFNGDEKRESSPPLGSEIPYESDRKGKFRMIIDQTKKDGHEQLSKESQQQIGVGVDVDAAAAILQAVRKGIKTPTLEIFAKASHEFGSRGTNREDRESTSVSSDKVSSKAETAVAAEADSAEAHLTKEEKLKVERLRRAKMFTAMLKSGAASVKTQLSCGSSLETPKSEVSGASAVANFPLLGREGGSDAMNVSCLDNVRESDSKASVDEQIDRRLRRRYRSRAETHNEEQEYEDEEDEVGDKFKETNHKLLRKKRGSHRPSHHSRERDKNRKGPHRHESSDDEPHDSRRHRHESSSDYDDHSRSCQHKHRGLSDDERSKSRRNHQSKHDDSSDNDNRLDDHRHRKHPDIKIKHHEESDKRKRKFHGSDEELEEGEKASDNTSIAGGTSDILSSSLGQPSEGTDVNNDFRAKIRAMLMSTM